MEKTKYFELFSLLFPAMQWQLPFHTCIKVPGDKHVFMQIQKGHKSTCYNKSSDKVLLLEPINITVLIASDCHSKWINKYYSQSFHTSSRGKSKRWCGPAYTPPPFYTFHHIVNFVSPSSSKNRVQRSHMKDTRSV
jgi:hypothetical protein